MCGPQQKTKESTVKISTIICLGHFRPQDHQNRVWHVENPPHTNVQLIWCQERRVMTILRNKCIKIRNINVDFRMKCQKSFFQLFGSSGSISKRFLVSKYIGFHPSNHILISFLVPEPYSASWYSIYPVVWLPMVVCGHSDSPKQMAGRHLAK